MKSRRSFAWVPNAITSIRLIAVVPVFISALQGAWALGLWVMMLALTSDFFDGMMARKLGVSSSFGAVLDAYADFTLSAAGILGLVFAGQFPIGAAVLMAVPAAVMIYARRYAPHLKDLIVVLPMFEVGTLFLAWTYVIWAYATLAYGWSWWYISLTLGVLLILGTLKRARVRVWCAAILPKRYR
jgi:phosphatidylglycerophosphate synthase